jgi:hypothetical protein
MSLAGPAPLLRGPSPRPPSFPHSAHPARVPPGSLAPSAARSCCPPRPPIARGPHHVHSRCPSALAQAQRRARPPLPQRACAPPTRCRRVPCSTSRGHDLPRHAPLKTTQPSLPPSSCVLRRTAPLCRVACPAPSRAACPSALGQPSRHVLRCVAAPRANPWRAAQQRAGAPSCGGPGGQSARRRGGPTASLRGARRLATAEPPRPARWRSQPQRQEPLRMRWRGLPAQWRGQPVQRALRAAPAGADVAISSPCPRADELPSAACVARPARRSGMCGQGEPTSSVAGMPSPAWRAVKPFVRDFVLPAKAGSYVLIEEEHRKSHHPDLLWLRPL